MRGFDEEANAIKSTKPVNCRKHVDPIRQEKMLEKNVERNFGYYITRGESTFVF